MRTGHRPAEHYAIRVIGDRVESMQPCENGIDLLTCRGERHNFDIIYPSLGARFRSELALQLGLDCDECGGVKVDQHLRPLRGLYAIGDVTLGLKQISVAIGRAAQAATAVHNSRRPTLGRLARPRTSRRRDRPERQRKPSRSTLTGGRGSRLIQASPGASQCPQCLRPVQDRYRPVQFARWDRCAPPCALPKACAVTGS